MWDERYESHHRIFITSSHCGATQQPFTCCGSQGWESEMLWHANIGLLCPDVIPLASCHIVSISQIWLVESYDGTWILASALMRLLQTSGAAHHAGDDRCHLVTIWPPPPVSHVCLHSCHYYRVARPLIKMPSCVTYFLVTARVSVSVSCVPCVISDQRSAPEVPDLNHF